MSLWQQRLVALVPYSVLIVAVCITGCDQATELLAKTETIVVEQDPLTELLLLTEQAAEFAAGSGMKNAGLRAATRKNIAKATPLADRVLERPDLADDHRVDAERAKLQLLMLDIQLGTSDSQQRFKTYFEELRTNESPAADFGEWLVLQASCLDDKTSYPQAMAAMQAYATKHPTAIESWELFMTYGEQLRERGYAKQAVTCFSAVANVKLDPTNKKLVELASIAKEQADFLHKALAKEAKKQAEIERENAKYYARLGSQEDRIFVIERRVTSKGKTGYIFRTFHGRKSVLTLVKYIEMGDWSVRGTFPLNKDGIQQAKARTEQLTKNMIVVPNGHKGF